MQVLLYNLSNFIVMYNIVLIDSWLEYVGMGTYVGTYVGIIILPNFGVQRYVGSFYMEVYVSIFWIVWEHFLGCIVAYVGTFVGVVVLDLKLI